MFTAESDNFFTTTKFKLTSKFSMKGKDFSPVFCFCYTAFFLLDEPAPFQSPTNNMKFEDIYPDPEDEEVFVGANTNRSIFPKTSSFRDDGNGNSSQVTRAAKQFSAPKSFKDYPNEYVVLLSVCGFLILFSLSVLLLLSRRSSEFSRSPARNRNSLSRSRSKYNSDDEEDVENYPNRGRSNDRSSADERVGTEEVNVVKKQDRKKKQGTSSRSMKAFEEEKERNETFHMRDDEDGREEESDLRSSKESQNKKSTRKNSKRQPKRYPSEDENDNHNTSSNTSSTRREESSRQQPQQHRQPSTSLPQELIISSPAPVVIVPPDLSNMRKFLTSPIPVNNGILQCYIKRNTSGTNMLFPKYSLFFPLQEENGRKTDIFLMASKKRSYNKTSNYAISMNDKDINKKNDDYLGKVRSNFFGTEYQIFDDGMNVKDQTDDVDGNSGSKFLIGCLLLFLT
jgi:hypothetical protein